MSVKGLVTYLESEVHKKFKRLCEDEGYTIKDGLGELVKKYIHERETEGKTTKGREKQETM